MTLVVIVWIGGNNIFFFQVFTFLILMNILKVQSYRFFFLVGRGITKITKVERC